MANVYFSCCSVLQIINNLRVNNRFAVLNNTHSPSPSSYTLTSFHHIHKQFWSSQFIPWTEQPTLLRSAEYSDYSIYVPPGLLEGATREGPFQANLFCNVTDRREINYFPTTLKNQLLQTFAQHNCSVLLDSKQKKSQEKS